MARGWHRGLVLLVACSPQPARSFLPCRLSPRTLSRPDGTTARRHAGTTVVTARAAADGDGDGIPTSPPEGAEAGAPAPVKPSLDRSAPLSFIANNNVNLDGDFVISREGEPTAEELANENLIKVVAEKSTDDELNWLLWKCLGYRYNPETDTWKPVSVFPRWQERYPEPVDFVGVTRIYDPRIDKPVKTALQTLVRSVRPEFKQLLVDELKPLGFTGLKLDELTPNRTRRAQLVNFLLYYREHLWGVPLEEVERRRVERQEQAARDEAAKAAEAQSSADKE
eukprot:g6175.t1